MFESDGKFSPKYEDGAFELSVTSIEVSLKEPITPSKQAQTEAFENRND